MKILILLVACGFLSTTIGARSQTPSQDKKAAKIARIKNMIDSRSYVFQAQSVMPLGGRTRQLTSDYEVEVNKESIVSYLPYFGKAYSAPIDPTKGGIEFTSKDFDYSATAAKKDGWDILIKPKDVQDVQQLSLSVSSEGYASLHVMSTSRQPISFSGIIVPKRLKK
jgi:Domain of unknown function (DUF4251)